MFTQALITPYDVLAAPDEPLRLEVLVERRILPFIDPALEGVEVEVEGLGRATTNSAGWAAFQAPPLPLGIHRRRVWLAAGAWRTDDAEALIAVVSRDTPILITDIDMTIARCSSLGHAFRSDAKIRPLPEAVEALREIAQSMSVVYLTARDHIYLNSTKAWLQGNGFPEGPVYLRRRRVWSLSSRRHKLARLGEIAPRFRNIRWGVGDRESDMRAYAAFGIPSIIISAKPPDRRRKGARHAANWDEALKIVKEVGCRRA